MPKREDLIYGGLLFALIAGAAFVGAAMAVLVFG